MDGQGREDGGNSSDFEVTIANKIHINNHNGDNHFPVDK
jgi:hypothetical protein